MIKLVCPCCGRSDFLKYDYDDVYHDTWYCLCCGLEFDDLRVLEKEVPDSEYDGYGLTKSMKHLKDREIIKQKTQRNAGLKLLKEICEKGYNNDGTKNVSYLCGELREKEPSKIKTNPKHEKCAGYYKKCNTENREKSICRCMFYYDENKKKCRESCKFKRKWHYVGSGIQITDYETPMEYRIEGIGNIDLRIKYKDVEYGVEVKPPENNNETICRMISEAMTYTIDFPSYRPAIAVFGPSTDGKYKGSPQYISIRELLEQNNEDFSAVRNYVKVFIITIKGDKDGKVVDFTIEPLD